MKKILLMFVGIMKNLVFRFRVKQHKIFKSIVRFIMIHVVYSFCRFKDSAKMFFHDKSMFGNKTSTVFIRMFRRINPNIVVAFSNTTLKTRRIFIFSIIKSISFFKRFGHFLSLIPRNLSFSSIRHNFTIFLRHFFAFIPRSLSLFKSSFRHKTSFNSFVPNHCILLFCIIIASATASVNISFAADNWDVDAPAGTDNASDLDTYINTNNASLERILSNYRNGCDIYYISASSIGVAAGEIVGSNSSGSIRKFRKNTSALSLTWSDLDTGSETISTQYYVYALADADATTFTAKISANSSAPQHSGTHYYKKIGSFYNNSSGDIECGGKIMMWSGTTATIPTGWVLCDGNNGTPDLTDRFIFGAGNLADPGDSNTFTNLTGTGSSIKNLSGSNAKADGGGTCTGQNRDMMPPYYALAYIMAQGAE